ncbi:MAG: MOSC domain-containing protein [Acidobacteriota bacterium]|nr:MOSC domain-containing protein [Acidobacteriota bacterium]
MSVTISGLHIYPLKAGTAVDLTKSRVDSLGLAGDRRWMLVGEDMVYMGQRKTPKMAVLKSQIIADGLKVSAPGMGDLFVNKTVHARHTVQLHKETIRRVADLGDEAAGWFSEFMETPCRLVYMDEICKRPLVFVPGKPGEHLGFADALPLLILSEASLVGLNDRLAEPVTMRRFRPNIVVRDCAAHEEDRWRLIRIGDVSFRGEIPCNRCVVTTVNQQTAEKDLDGEPLKTLTAYRKTEKGKVNFGMTFVPLNQGVIRIGDAVEVLESESAD